MIDKNWWTEVEKKERSLTDLADKLTYLQSVQIALFNKSALWVRQVFGTLESYESLMHEIAERVGKLKVDFEKLRDLQDQEELEQEVGYPVGETPVLIDPFPERDTNPKHFVDYDIHDFFDELRQLFPVPTTGPDQRETIGNLPKIRWSRGNCASLLFLYFSLMEAGFVDDDRYYSQTLSQHFKQENGKDFNKRTLINKKSELSQETKELEDFSGPDRKRIEPIIQLMMKITDEE